MSRKKNARPLEETAYFSLAAGKPVIVGLSGGADSVALAYWLRESGALLIAAHVNHGLRGEESDRDEAFVREFCRKIDIPLRVRRLDIGAMARKDAGNDMHFSRSWQKNGMRMRSSPLRIPCPTIWKRYCFESPGGRLWKDYAASRRFAEGSSGRC